MTGMSTSPGKRMSPLLTMSIGLTVLLCLVSVNKFSPVLIDGLLAASIVGTVARYVWLVRREQRSAHAHKALDFAQVTAARVLPYLTWLKENVRGHDEVVEAVARQIQSNAKIAGPGRTLGAFLLVGPTGTGKTFFAKLVAEVLYPGVEPVIVSMNQYKNPSDVFTLLGSLPGAMGAGVGGTLTRPVLENPYRVVIFDEIDKCHPDIRQCLFDVLDQGRCVDKCTGEMVHFNGCVFFGTSNEGVKNLRGVEAQKGDFSYLAAQNRKALGEGSVFEKAFLSRWDGVYLMDELPSITVAEVACLEMARQWAKFGIELKFASPSLLAQTVVKNGDFREYGVRQLAFLIRSAADSAIGEAKSRGYKNVCLDVDVNSGRIKIATDVAKRKAG